MGTGGTWLLAKLREALTVSPAVKPLDLTLANERRFKGADVGSEQRAIRSCFIWGAVGTIGEGEIERFPSTRGRGAGGVVAGPGPELRRLDCRGWLVFNAAHHTRDHENSDHRTCFHHARSFRGRLSSVNRIALASTLSLRSMETIRCGSRLIAAASSRRCRARCAKVAALLDLGTQGPRAPVPHPPIDARCRSARFRPVLQFAAAPAASRFTLRACSTS
jgi:hypothetical protein